MVTVVKAPENAAHVWNTWKRGELRPKTIFLAGSIEMGKAEDWQTVVTNSLHDTNCTIFNPRRDDWDSSWVQSIDNPQFYEQVRWELDHLNLVDLIVLYLSPGTQSPISLLELGLFAASAQRNLVVCCPEGFWRKGNVDIVCNMYEIDTVNSLEELVQYVKSYVGNSQK